MYSDQQWTQPPCSCSSHGAPHGPSQAFQDSRKPHIFAPTHKCCPVPLPHCKATTELRPLPAGPFYAVTVSEMPPHQSCHMVLHAPGTRFPYCPSQRTVNSSENSFLIPNPNEKETSRYKMPFASMSVRPALSCLPGSQRRPLPFCCFASQQHNASLVFLAPCHPLAKAVLAEQTSFVKSFHPYPPVSLASHTGCSPWACTSSGGCS